MTFWERLYDLCKENGTKPNPVAAKLGISSGAITHWKNGTIPKGDVLIILSDYFNVSVDYLLGKTDIKKEQTTHEEQSVPENLKLLIDKTSNLPDDQIDKVLEYVEFLKSQRK